jgi:hypothetical protein
MITFYIRSGGLYPMQRSSIVKKNRLLLFFCLLPILIISMSASALARDISLAWDPTDDPYVAGYRLYYTNELPTGPFDGADLLEGPSPIDIGPTLTATVQGLDPDRIYYFAVTAYDAWGNESSFSNVIASHWQPAALFPQNEAVLSLGPVEFMWESAPEDIEIVSYNLHYSTDANALSNSLAMQTAPASALLAGMAFFGIMGLGLRAGRTTRGLLLLAAAGSFFLVSGCGGGSDGDFTAPPDNWTNIEDHAYPEINPQVQIVTGLEEASHMMYDLEAGTTYYWKIVAVDSTGAEHESPVYRFTTEAF